MRKNGEKSQEKREKPDFELGKIQKRSAGLGYLTSFAAVFFLLTPLLHVQTDSTGVCVCGSCVLLPIIKSPIMYNPAKLECLVLSCRNRRWHDGGQLRADL